MIKNAFLLLAFLLLSCQPSHQEKHDNVVARVGDDFLYMEDIIHIIPEGVSKEDSVVIVKNFIDQWAKQKLLLKVSLRNITEEKKAAFDKLIEEYKNDLYVNDYIDKVVKTSVDTVITDNELKEYYQINKENFRTNSSLFQLRYIHLPKEHPKFSLIKSKFLDFRKNDKKFWETYQLQFKNSALNDSVWVDINEVFKKLPFITPENREKYLQEGISFEQPDNQDVYLVKIKRMLARNQVSPFEYIKPTLHQIILNKRKLDLIKKFESEITSDAINNKQYEIYK